jgi:hypothetical protein
MLDIMYSFATMIPAAIIVATALIFAYLAAAAIAKR